MISSGRIKVLVAEDEEHLGEILASFLTERGCAVTLVRDGEQAWRSLSTESFDVALLDIVMPGREGLELLEKLRHEPSPPEVIVITGNATVEIAISAMKLGAFDFLSKPYRMAEIEVQVRRAAEKRARAREHTVLQTRLARVDPTPEIVTCNAAMHEALELIRRVARSDSPVLITGESGTGKELVARALHSLSGRNGPLTDLNCAAIGADNVEIDLFGADAGATRDNVTGRAGLLELATGGSLFLDEVSGLDARVQAALLRALEQRTFFRVGGQQKVEMDARLITATNRDLQEMVDAGSFRPDLFYRINTISIALPPLRERPEDIFPLATHFLAIYGGAQPPSLTQEALQAMQRYRWPGNVRELRNVIERAVLLAKDGVIAANDLPLRPVTANGAAATNGSEAAPLVPLLDVERRHILHVLESVHWHQGRAATILGISSKTLYRKIREFGFQRRES